MQLQIKPGLRQGWRGPQTVQIGLDARRGTVIGGLTSRDRTLIEQLTAGLDDDALDAGGRLRLSGDERARELVRLLSDAGVLIRSRAGRAALSRLGPHRERLQADAEVWSVVHQGEGDAWELLAARAGREVEVVGGGRTGAGLATMLAAAGVGRVRVRDPDPVRPTDVVPGGAGMSDVGSPREDAVRLALHRLGHQPCSGRRRPDLVVLVEHTVADASGADPLLAADVPHLSVVAGEAGATVGPMVLPGRGPCLRCLELHRTDRDPGWPQLLAQLLSGRRGTGAEESTCASLTAALACLQVVSHLDGVKTPAALAATLEVELPDGLISRRTWPAHPACGCHWPPTPRSASGPVSPGGPPHESREADRVGASDRAPGRMRG
jgi:hypothetical protein